VSIKNSTQSHSRTSTSANPISTAADFTLTLTPTHFPQGKTLVSKAVGTTDDDVNRVEPIITKALLSLIKPQKEHRTRLRKRRRLQI
jgi:hypothetical protein